MLVRILACAAAAALALSGCGPSIQSRRIASMNAVVNQCQAAKLAEDELPVTKGVVDEEPGVCAQWDDACKAAISRFAARLEIAYPDAVAKATDALGTYVRAYPPKSAVDYMVTAEAFMRHVTNEIAGQRCEAAKDSVRGHYDAEEAAAAARRRRAIGAALQGFGQGLQQAPAPSPVNCTTTAVGTTAYTHCQ